MSLRHFVYVWILAVAAYVVREIVRRRRRVNPRRPAMRIEEAWEHWEAGIRKHPDRALTPPELDHASVPAAAREDCRAHLEGIGRLAEDATSERGLVRRAILSSATLSLLLELIVERDESARRALIHGYEPALEPLLATAASSARLRWIVLREYARWKLDDAVPDDWFHRYMRVAKPYLRERVRLSTEFMLRAEEGTRRFVELYDALLGEQRERALKSPPKRRYVRPDLE